MLKALVILLYISTGFAVIVAYGVADEMIESDAEAGAIILAITFWPMFPIADGLERVGIGHVD